MRILVVTHYYPAHAGGIEIVAGMLASRLAASHDVVWLASDCDSAPAETGGTIRFVPMRSNNTIEGLTGLPFPVWGPRSLARLWKETGDADIVHLHDFAYFGNWAAFVCATLRNRPVLITQHVGFIPYRSLTLRLALRLVHATIGRVMLGAAGQVVFVSGVVQEYYARFVHFRRPPLVVANGVDTATFVPAAAEGRERARSPLALDASRPVLLFVGRFVEKKGLHILEALAKRMPDVSWVFAGWGPLNPRRWNAPNVHVFDDRRGAALVPLYQAADLLVLPSVGEGLPLVLQESMSCGTPAVVGEDTARALDGPAGVVFACPVGGSGTVEAWEALLRRLLTDPHAMSKLRRTVADFARARWSWNVCAAGYLALFEQLAPHTMSTRCVRPPRRVQNDTSEPPDRLRG
jgi:glycosyltransferase involved in cell wall biosynthesis